MILLYTILITIALFFGGSRAVITRFIWSRYPPTLDRFMDCPMCSGAWYGALVSIVFTQLGYHYPGLEDWHAPFVLFLCSAIWTPVGAGVVQRLLFDVGLKESAADEIHEA